MRNAPFLSSNALDIFKSEGLNIFDDITDGPFSISPNIKEGGSVSGDIWNMIETDSLDDDMTSLIVTLGLPVEKPAVVLAPEMSMSALAKAIMEEKDRLRGKPRIHIEKQEPVIQPSIILNQDSSIDEKFKSVVSKPIFAPIVEKKSEIIDARVIGFAVKVPQPPMFLKKDPAQVEQSFAPLETGSLFGLPDDLEGFESLDFAKSKQSKKVKSKKKPSLKKPQDNNGVGDLPFFAPISDEPSQDMVKTPVSLDITQCTKQEQEQEQNPIDAAGSGLDGEKVYSLFTSSDKWA